MVRYISIGAAMALCASCISAVDNGLAITPQMGWNNWNAFACNVSEALLLQTGRLIVNYGLRDLGYYYVVLDDCWSAGRNASDNHSLIADPQKFPRGMAAVADDIHFLGLGFGMYSDAGRYTCAGYEGSLGYETVDANTWATWGVDYLKYDNCYNDGQAGNQFISHARYAVMAASLNATGRPILYSLCNWGEDFPWYWASTIANSWRMSGDIYDSWNRPDPRCPCDGDAAWNCQLPGFRCSVTNIMNKASFVVTKSRPGGWNDLDMLEVGNGAMTDAEYVAHFSLWAVVKSPLIMGNDIRVIKPGDLSILSNAAIIAVSQDPLGKAAIRRWIWNTGDSDDGLHSMIQMWSGSLKSTTGGREDDAVVLLINGGKNAREMNATLTDIFVDSGPHGTAKEAHMMWEVRDLWADRMSDEEAGWIIGNGSATETRTMTYNATKTSYAEGLANLDEALLGKVATTLMPSGTLTATVDSHGARVFRLRAVQPLAAGDL